LKFPWFKKITAGFEGGNPAVKLVQKGMKILNFILIKYISFKIKINGNNLSMIPKSHPPYCFRI